MASVVGRGGAASPALALGDLEEEDDEDILRESREGAARAAATKRYIGPWAEDVVVRAQGCKCVNKARFSGGGVVRAHGSEGALVGAQVSECAVVEAQGT